MTGKERVLAFLKEHGASTDDEIAAGCEMSPSSARTRRHELEIDGLVVPVGRVKTQYGKTTFLWAFAKDKIVEFLRQARKEGLVEDD
jgi:predicted ArsR family transcriptional regulator